MPIALALTVLVLAVIAFCLWFFERMLARKPSRVLGLAFPAILLVVSIFSVVQAAPTVFSQLDTVGGIGGAIVTLLVSFGITNIATVWVAIVYHRTRRKMGDMHPWSFRKQDEQATASSREPTDKK